MSATATLGGVPLVAVDDFSWPLSEGTRPQQKVFETDAADAAAILRVAGQPVDFVVQAPGHPSLTVKGLSILSTRPGSRPDTIGLLVADRRWRWPHMTIARDFNVRRRSGDTRLVGEGSLRQENLNVVQDVAYAPWSLKNGARWRALDVIESILSEIAPGGFTIEPIQRQIEVEDLSLAGPADMALETALQYCGGLGVTVDPDGRVRVFDRRSRAEVRALLSAGPVIQQSGYFATVDRRFSRPKSIRVYFERECELRFDYLEDTQLTTVVRDHEPRRLENVAPLPDTTLSVNGKTLSMGTWVTIDDLLTAWTSLAPAWSYGALTQTMIRRYYVGMPSMLVTRFAGVQGTALSDDRWARRIATVLKHWRKTFRILPAWMDKIRAVKPIRAAIVDVETGRPAKALAWQDYISVPSYLPMIDSFFGKAPTNPDLGRQIAGYPTDAGATLSAETASPANVLVPDDQAGILRVELQTDREYETERMIPGSADGLPKAKCTDTRRLGNFKATLADVTLDSGFKLAVVLTAVQACPNNLGRYHCEEVTPGQAGTTLGAPVGPCEAEPWSVFVSANVMPARFAWSDALSAQIDEAFYSGGPYPPSLCVNKSIVRNIAESEAARQYGTMLDRVEGSFAVGLNPDLLVRGAIRQVEHRIATDGIATSVVSIDPDIEPLDMHALLPQGDQRAIRKMVAL